MRLKHSISVLFLSFICFYSFLFAQETLTITTYYPSPYGSYRELRSQRMAIGDNYITSSYCWPPTVCVSQIDANADLVVEGNVGIGTAVPALNSSGKVLHVHESSTGASAIHFTNNTTGAGAANGFVMGRWVDGSYGNGIILWNYASTPITFATGSIERMYIDGTSGNVGIGTTNPAVKFHIHEPAANAYQYITAGGVNNPIIHLGTDYGGAGEKWGTIYLDTTGKLKLLSGGSLSSPGITVDTSGNVGIGTTTPSGKLDVAGTIYATLGSVAGAANMRYNNGTRQIGWNDLAELFDTSEDVEPGDVLAIDADRKLKKSNKAYDTCVAGIVSEAPAILFEGSRLQILPQSYKFTSGRKPPVALAGRVLCKVITSNGEPIKIGDLLVTSSKPGYAMKGDPEKIQIGTVLGKAMEPLEKGEGKITVLVALQ